MASSSTQSSAYQGPWFSMRRAFRNLHHPRISGSYKTKHFAEKNPDFLEHNVTAYRIFDPFRSSDTISSAQASTSLPDARLPSTSSLNIECPLCMQSLPGDNFFSFLTCQHRSCLSCLKTYLRIEITEGRVGIACPECPEKLNPSDIRKILDDEVLMQKYEDFMLRHVLVLDPDTRWCPAPDCGYVVIANGCASCPQLTCKRPGCGTLFCYHCKQTWHPNQTCDAARAERSRTNLHLSSELGKEQGSQSLIKACPRCGSLIMKLDDGSCNHMNCAGCGAEFCWLCLREISDLHYLSPSGCTFWGKKPWSRRRKILWQVGMLIGAPVGISLIAGVAFPVVIIGLPILVGRKLLAKCRHMAKRKRHLIVASGVVASTLVSPVLAAIAIGVGVPMLLAYVYGVVPVSLCRDSCCSGRGQKHASDFEIDLKEMQDVVTGNYKGNIIPASSSTPVMVHAVEEAFPSPGSSTDQPTNSSTVKMEVQAEVNSDHAQQGTSSQPLPGISNPSVDCSNLCPKTETISDNRDLGKNCVSISDASLCASSLATSFVSASSVAGANSSSSSIESDRPRLPYHRGKKMFGDGISSHGATSGTACHVKSFKRQSMSVGDSIDERVEAAERGYLSLHSLAEEEACLESFTGGSDIIAMVAVSEENPAGDSHGKSRGVRCSASVAAALATDSGDYLPNKLSNGSGSSESKPAVS